MRRGFIVAVLVAIVAVFSLSGCGSDGSSGTTEGETAAKTEAATTKEKTGGKQASNKKCDPHYSGCVPPYPPDVSCEDVKETVTVYGKDPHDLDKSGDGTGCEDYPRKAPAEKPSTSSSDSP